MGIFDEDYSWLFGKHDLNGDGITDLMEVTEIIDDDDRINEEIEAERLEALHSYEDEDELEDFEVGNDAFIDKSMYDVIRIRL